MPVVAGGRRPRFGVAGASRVNLLRVVEVEVAGGVPGVGSDCGDNGGRENELGHGDGGVGGFGEEREVWRAMGKGRGALGFDEGASGVRGIEEV